MIVSSVIVINRPNGSELDRRIREIHTDHLGGETVFNYNVLLNVSGNVVDSEGVILFISLTEKTAANAVIAERRLADKEVNQWIADINSGLDPAHIDIGGYFVNSVPEFNVWTDALSNSVVPFLQTEQPEHTQALVKISDLWGRLTNKEGEDIAGKPNDVAAEIQTAINAQVANEAYIPLINKEGLPRA